MDLFDILTSKPGNEHFIKRYVKFIRWCMLQGNKKGEAHHICPKAKDMFPEYRSFKEHPWNFCRLTPRQHYIAHWMLWKAYGGSQTRSFWVFNHCQSHRITSRVYEKLKIEFGKNQSRLMSKRPKSAEHAEKLRKILLEKTNTAEQRARCSNRMANRVVSEDERKKIADGVSKHVSNTVWINNGLENKRILAHDQIPDGWKRGRLMNKELKAKLLQGRGL